MSTNSPAPNGKRNVESDLDAKSAALPCTAKPVCECYVSDIAKAEIRRVCGRELVEESTISVWMGKKSGNARIILVEKNEEVFRTV